MTDTACEGAFFMAGTKAGRTMQIGAPSGRVAVISGGIGMVHPDKSVDFGRYRESPLIASRCKCLISLSCAQVQNLWITLWESHVLALYTQRATQRCSAGTLFVPIYFSVVNQHLIRWRLGLRGITSCTT
jgi:hypothetical protein